MPTSSPPTATSGARSSLGIAALVAALLAVPTTLACTVAPMPADVGAIEDTGLSEGGIIREDAGARPDAPGSDASSDAGTSMCEGLCDPRSEDGCPDGTCVLSGESPSCELDAGAADEGAACDSVTACAHGLACFRAARSSGGVCAQICCPGDASSCGDVARCGGDGVLVDGTETSWGRCVLPRPCDLLAAELTCEAREGCYVVDPGGTTECRLAGSAGAGDACVVPEDCASGLFCGGIGERTCLRVCSIASPRTCTGDERCVAQTYSPEGTGVCVLDTALRP